VLEIVSDEHAGLDLHIARGLPLKLDQHAPEAGQWTGELKNRIIERLSARINAHDPVEFQRAAKRAISTVPSRMSVRPSL
jgi:hypothetical protein